MIYQDIGCACEAAAQDIGFGRRLKRKLKRAVQPKRVIRRAVLLPKRILKTTLKPHKALLRLAGQGKAARRLDGAIDTSTDTIVQVATPIADQFSGGAASAVMNYAGMTRPDEDIEPAPVDTEPAGFPWLPAALVAGGGLLLFSFLRR